MKFLSFAHVCITTCCCVFSAISMAQPKLLDSSFDSEPHQIVHDTTEQVLGLLQDASFTSPEALDVLINELSNILEPVIAFDFIAKGVMSSYASQASEEQLARFSTALQRNLISTYSKGLSAFSQFELVVLPPKEPLGEQRRTSVVQEARNGSGVNQVAYSMAKNRQGQWKVINILLNGINLGETLRSQFAAKAKMNDGDLDKTIDGWG